jgi:hypothetical protein
MKTPNVERSKPSSAWRGRVVLVVTLVLLALVVSACGGDDSHEEGDLKVSGVIVDVQGDITAIEQFDLVVEDGTRFTFVPEAGSLERSGFSPAHIREHSALVEPISVTYHEVDGQNMVTGVGDADE